MRLIMYVVVNQDLEMSSGKVAAQVGHAVFDYVERLVSEDELPIKYLITLFKENGDTICVLKAPEKQLRKLVEEGYVGVIDRGYTEIPHDSLTAVNLGLYDRERADDIPKWIRRLRVL